MPYVSEKQRRYMHAEHPAIAARWDREYGGGALSTGTKGSDRDSAPRSMTAAMKQGGRAGKLRRKRAR